MPRYTVRKWFATPPGGLEESKVGFYSADTPEGAIEAAVVDSQQDDMGWFLRAEIETPPEF